jgi:hypothetical protein
MTDALGQPQRSTDPHLGGASHLLYEQRAQPVDLQRNCPARLGDEIDCPSSTASSVASAPFLGQG